ncbi:MAG: ProQ/FINO family protein, partial [Aquabacterium sp.]|nr:ProQ/FINO family protein [Aquabacterium sp.]
MPDPTDLPVPDPATGAVPLADTTPEATDQRDSTVQATPAADAAVTEPATNDADASADTNTDAADAEDASLEAEQDAAQAAEADHAPAPGTPALPQLNPAAAADLLRKHFPGLFSGPAKPFKLRIQQDIQARAPGVFSKGTLSAFFRRHTGSTGYLIALSKASHRFDLDGQPAGELSDEHKQAAVAELARRRQLTREREQQAQAQQSAQHREAQRVEMAQQAEQMQARQARAALLRDFQRTTLTLANFCALKGLTPEALNPQLEQAKKEAAEAPPVPTHAFDDRRPRRDDPRNDG